MINLRVGGVPEHFNLPWHLCLEEGLFEKAGINVQWTDFPGGTGAMTRELRHDGLDVALVLTEGIVADISLGNRSKIVSFYTSTPLQWGVHTTAYNKFEVVKDVDPMIFSISRWGSGSHLMAYVYARKRGLNPMRDIAFKIVGDLTGARESLADKTSNLFLWEKFTTKPYVDSGELKILDIIPTPWPCFAIAAREDILSKESKAVNDLVHIVLNRAKKFKQDPESIKLVARRYGQKSTDVKEWLKITDWVGKPGDKFDSFQTVIDSLTELNIIKTELQVDKIIAK